MFGKPPEPWANTVNDAGTMLDQLRIEWASSNPVLSNANWDLVHLMSKRPDTGTGGIAYLGVVCSPRLRWAFRAPWTTNPTLTIPSPNFTWNLFVVSTNWDTTLDPTTPTGADGLADLITPTNGSAERTIDNCYETGRRLCRRPLHEQGTIMSYCHLQPSARCLQFHPVVEQAALFPTINANGFCHGNCAAIETSCGSYGCTDPSACNYNPDAYQDDGSWGD